MPTSLIPCSSAALYASVGRFELSSYKQVTEEMLRDTSTSVDIYSALHDPIRGYVRLFLEFFPIHPHEKAEDEPDPFPHEIFRGCVFSHHRNFSQSKEVRALEVSTPVIPLLRPCNGR